MRLGNPWTRFIVGIFFLLAPGIGHQCLAEVHTYGIVSDLQEPTPNAAKVRESLLRERIRRLIMPGDQLADPTLQYDDIWKPWFNAGFVFEAVALGNHYRSTYDEEIRYFGMPGEFFSKVRGDVRFIVLNSDNIHNAGRQARWLNEELSLAGERFIFVLFHHPPYTLCKTHPWEERKEFHLRVRPVLWRHRNRITAIFVGHNHISGIFSIGGVPVVVSGATAIPRPETPWRHIDGDVRVIPLWHDNERPHWTRMDIDTRSGDVWFNFVDATRDKVDCSVNIQEGRMTLFQNCAASRRSRQRATH